MCGNVILARTDFQEIIAHTGKLRYRGCQRNFCLDVRPSRRRGEGGWVGKPRGCGPLTRTFFVCFFISHKQDKHLGIGNVIG